MIHNLIIPGTLAGLNEYISKCNIHKLKGAELKKKTEMLISVHIRKQLRGVKISHPIIADFTWFEPNKKRDLDNISAGGKKFIFDALVKCGVLKGDGWAYVTGFTDNFYVDSDNPRIEVILREIEP